MVSKRNRVSLSRIVEQSPKRKDRKDWTAVPTKERTLAPGKQTPSIRILLVDDHPVVRAGLASMLSTIPGLAVCGAASTGEEALQLIDAEQPDGVLRGAR